MEKVRRIFGGDYLIHLYDGEKFLGNRKVYFHRGKYFVKYKCKYGEILDFNLGDKPLTCVFVDDLFFI